MIRGETARMILHFAAGRNYPNVTPADGLGA
jgi:hypothetical protein